MNSVSELEVLRVVHSLDAAIALVERKLPGWQWLVRNDEEKGFLANLHAPHENPNYGYACYPEWSSSAPIALLKSLASALAAVGSK